VNRSLFVAMVACAIFQKKAGLWEITELIAPLHKRGIFYNAFSTLLWIYLSAWCHLFHCLFLQPHTEALLRGSNQENSWGPSAYS